LLEKALPANRNIVSWNWNFGDGGSSTMQSPSHTYTANGTYTVSLTVSDGVNVKTETKNAYIIVGPSGMVEAEWEKAIKIFPVPTSDQLSIVSEIRLESVILLNMSGAIQFRKDDCGLACSLSLSPLPDGVYILKIKTEEGIMQRKVQVRR
jgi:hypothetical protein